MYASIVQVLKSGSKHKTQLLFAGLTLINADTDQPIGATSTLAG